PVAARALEHLDTEQANVSAALMWSFTAAPNFEIGVRLVNALWRYWQARSRFSGGYPWLQRAPAPPDATELARGELLHGLGQMARNLRDLPRAAEVLAESVTIARRMNDLPKLAWRLEAAGNIARVQGDAGKATSLLREALTLFRQVQDQVGIAWT